MNSSTRQVVARIRAVYGGWRRVTPVAQMRDDWNRLFQAPINATVSQVMANQVPCAWVMAPGVQRNRVVVYLHGGGFRLGSVQSHLELMARLSAQSGAAVLGVEYRLAPEHRYPAPLEDALQVFAWLQHQGYQGRQLALAGDSAGGGLALATMLAMLQEPRQPLPCAAFLMSAWTDLAATGRSYQTRAEADPIHQQPMILALAKAYLRPEDDPRHPLVSPLYASLEDLAQLPPMLLQVGDCETVLSDSESFAERAQAAGAQVELEVWPGMIHVFQQFPAHLPEALSAVAAGGRFLARHLNQSSQKEEAAT